jgi:hypothetical protein
MLYKFEKVVDGLTRYIDSEVITGMNDFQEFIARIAIGRVINNEKTIKDALANNGIIRTFGFIDSDGMVDVDVLMRDIKSAMNKRGKLDITIPMFGKMTFHPEDVDVIHRYIQAEGQS